MTKALSVTAYLSLRKEKMLMEKDTEAWQAWCIWGAMSSSKIWNMRCSQELHWRDCRGQAQEGHCIPYYGFSILFYK